MGNSKIRCRCIKWSEKLGCCTATHANKKQPIRKGGIKAAVQANDKNPHTQVIDVNKGLKIK